MLLLVLLALCASLAHGAITNARVIGSTNVQSLLSFEAMPEAQCAVEVSEEADFAPLVHDVDPELFAGAGSAALASGMQRVFVIGRRAVDQAADGNWYSRALQADTVHYYRVRCGEDAVAGSFRTANIPVGTTYPWPLPQDPDTGEVRWPTLEANDRSQTIVDPNYGTLIRRVSLPGDAPAEIAANGRAFANAAGANWSDPAAALSEDAAAARYSGTGRDWLILTQPNTESFPEFYVGTTGIDRITVRVRGAAEGSRPIELCLTMDGTNCTGPIHTLTLDASESVNTLGDATAERLFPADVLRNPRFGLMLRAGSGEPGAISIRHVDFDVSFSAMMSMPESGFQQVCAPVKVNGGYRCSVSSTQGTNHLFWINPDTGEARFLGQIMVRNAGANDNTCASSFAMFDTRDPNVYYCPSGLDGRAVLLKGTYTGNDVPQPSGAFAQFQWVNLTPAGNTVSELIQRFEPAYVPTEYPLTLQFIAGNYAVYRAWRGGQDSMAWLAVFNLGNGQPIGAGGTGGIVAAANSWSGPRARWCGLHTAEFTGHSSLFGWDANPLLGGGTGYGPFRVTLNSSVPASTGRFTVQVSGEPSPNLMPAEPGDVFVFAPANGDFLRIVQKNGPSQWVVERVLQDGREPVARGPGAELQAFCSARNLQNPTQGAYVYWDFPRDPRGRDWIVERQMTGGHITQRGEYRIMSASDGYSVLTPGLPRTFNQARTFGIRGNPRWAGSQANRAGDGLSGGHQQHPSYENYAATGRNNWFVDMVPFVGGLSNEISPVAGLSQVYRVVTPLARDAFPTFAACGGRQLKEIAGPIGDRDTYTFCVGVNCRSGAGAQDVLVNCPAPVSVQSRCDAPARPSSLCVGDLSPYGQSITQFFLDRAGTRNRVLSNGLFAWHNEARTRTYFDTAYSLPDGSWLMFAAWASTGRKDLFLLKVPRQPDFPADPAAGTTPDSRTISLTAPAGAAQVAIQHAGTTSTANCAGGCSVVVPLRPMELLALIPKFRDGSGAQVGTGPVQTHVAGGVSGRGVAPRVGTDALRNAFSYELKLAPGAIVSIFGENLAGCEAQAQAFPLPTELCGAALTVNGRRAPLFAALPGQINAQLPLSLAPGQPFEVRVEVDGQTSETLRVDGSAVGEVAPAIAAYTTGGSVQRAVVVNPDGSINGPERPLTAGNSATLYGNALGPTNPRVEEGQAAPAEPPAATASEVEVWINDVRQTVSFSGLAPGMSGLYQMNFTLDPATPVRNGDTNQVWLRVNSVDSPKLAVTLARP